MAQHYDIAVIGFGRSEILCAALMAKRGARVLLVDNGESGPTYKKARRPLPLSPLLVPHIKDAPAVATVVRELAQGPIWRTVLQPRPLAFQVVMPNHRFEIVGEQATPASLAEEVAWEFPQARLQVQEFFEKLFNLDQELTQLLSGDLVLVPETLRQRWTARGQRQRLATWGRPFAESPLLQPFAEHEEISDLLLSPLAFFANLPGPTMSTFGGVRLLAGCYRGAASFVDAAHLHDMLVQAARDAGVELRTEAVAKSIEADGKRLRTLTLQGERMSYHADFFISHSTGPFIDLLPSGKLHTRLLHAAQTCRPVETLLTLNLVVKRQVIPKGMGDALFLLNGRRAARGDDPHDPPLLMRRRPAINNEEHEVLTVACPAKTADIQRSPERLIALKALLWERVKRVVPFIEEHLVDRSLPLDTTEWDVESEQRRADPLMAHPYFEMDEPGMLGVGGRSVATPFKNLLHTGPDVVPGLGIEGEFAGAQITCAALDDPGKKSWAARPKN